MPVLIPADIDGTGMPFPAGAAMDFDHAVTLHSKWKRKLRRALAKHEIVLLPAEVSLDHKCMLGSWIYGEGARHSALPEYTSLKFEHARFHLAAAELLRRANAGDSMEGETEPCANSEFSKSSAAVIMAILAIKKKLLELRSAAG